MPKPSCVLRSMPFWGATRGSLKWLTAEALAKIGIDEAVKRLADVARS